MPFEVILPGMSENKTKNAKDTVISLLFQEWPLTAREIWYRAKKNNSSFNLSYKTVYWAVTELTDSGVLRRTDQGYKISMGWIQKLKSFSQLIEKRDIKKSSSKIDKV